MLDDANPYEIALQAHFEGLVYAGISTEEKLAIALDALADTATVKDTKLLARRLLERERRAELGAQIRDWLAYPRGWQNMPPTRHAAPQRRHPPLL